MINIIDKHNCCGCSACVQRCPKQCISLIEDNEGFLYPHVDTGKCINCGLCDKVCPLITPFDKQNPIDVLAVKNRNNQERIASSSGGVFIALAKTIIAKGGLVFGAVYDDNWEVKHIYAEDIESVSLMMGSKYLQSRIDNTFAEAETYLKQGRYVLFSGTPCQITGLKKYLRKEYENLLAVDFLCHGVPSPGVWRRYLNENFSSIKSNIKNIEFRNKTLHGWKNFNLVFRESINSDKGNILYSSVHKENCYMRGFLSDLYLRPSCYYCKCKNGASHSDITIADYWGINKVMPDFDDDTGVSLILLNTEKGKEIFNNLNMDIRHAYLKDAKPFNGGFKENIKQHPKRDLFFYEINSGNTVEDAVLKALKVSNFVIVKNKLKRIIKRIIG